MAAIVLPDRSPSMLGHATLPLLAGNAAAEGVYDPSQGLGLAGRVGVGSPTAKTRSLGIVS